MIFFYQIRGSVCSDDPDCTSEHGRITSASSLDDLRKKMMPDSFYEPSEGEHRFVGNLVLLDTGDVLFCNSGYTIPKWVNNPLFVAIKASQFKASRKKVYDCTPDNAPL